MNAFPKPSLRYILLLFVILFCNSAVARQSAASYTLSIVPQYSPAELYRDWSPLAERIKRETGINLEIKIAASIPRFEAEFINGTPDFAYMNPYHAVMARKDQGYIPLLRDSKQLAGILLVRRDSPYTSVQDLNGKVIGFPAPNSFGASLYMRALLTEKFKIKFESRYLKTHSNVFRHLAQGNVEAGGTIMATFNDERPELREQLRILYETPTVASHPVVAHPRVPKRVREAVADAILALQKDEAGRSILKSIRMPQPVRADYQLDYMPLDKLGIQKFLVLDKE